jgi:hypothetical protein
MSNPYAMELLRQSLGSYGSGYSGGCCGGVLLGGAKGDGTRKPKQYVSVKRSNLKETTLANLQRAAKGESIGRMSGKQYLALHSDTAREAAAVARAANKNAAIKAWNDSLKTPTPMTKEQFCVKKCQVSAENRKIKSKQSAAIRKALKQGVAIPASAYGPLLAPAVPILYPEGKRD